MGARLPIAFLAGFASVITPCVLPLVPGYLSAVSSVEAGRLGERDTVGRVVRASIPFILGFTVVFVVLGAGAAAIGGTVSGTAQSEIAGFVLVVLGLAFVGLIPVPSAPAAAPTPTPPAHGTGVGERLRRLQELYEQGYITELEYRRRRAAILDAMPVTLHGTSGDGDDSADSCSS